MTVLTVLRVLWLANDQSSCSYMRHDVLMQLWDSYIRIMSLLSSQSWGKKLSIIGWKKELLERKQVKIKAK